MEKRKVLARRLFGSVAPSGAGGSLFREVKRNIVVAIEDGRLPAGGALPSESELADCFGVSIGTVRRAVDELVAEHIVVRRQGLGTFVATHNAERFLFQFFHVERSDGLREIPELELIAFERAKASEEESEALDVRPGDPVIVVENRLRLQGRAVIYDRLTLPFLLFKGLSEKRFRDRPSTIYHLYQTELGVTVVRALERARAVTADRAVCRILGLPPGSPVLQIRRTALTFGDKPVEYRVSTIGSSLYEYVNMLSRPTK